MNFSAGPGAKIERPNFFEPVRTDGRSHPNSGPPSGQGDDELFNVDGNLSNQKRPESSTANAIRL
jgi:hypothetical protein